MAVSSYVTLTFRVFKDDETSQYIGHCDELNVATCGDTQADALAAIAEAVELYLSSLEEEGIRERVFAERGVTLIHDSPAREDESIVSVHTGEMVMRQSFPLAA